MPASADIFSDREAWARPLAWSTTLHGVLFGGILLYGVFMGHFRGEEWGAGGVGGAMSVNLVSSIPLPAPEVPTQNILASQSTGLSQSLPKAKEEPAPEAIPIPEKETKTKALRHRASTQPKPVLPPESNVVPYGEGGPVGAHYSMFSMPNANGGLSLTGSGGGDFGSRWGWYVDIVRRKVSENWLKYEVDPNVHGAQRVFLTFEISRSGQPGNIQIEQSSGVPSLDISAKRALERIDTFGPLPNDYTGSKVSVELWFDYRR